MPNRLATIIAATQSNDVSALEAELQGLNPTLFTEASLCQAAVECKINGFPRSAKALLRKAAAAYPTSGTVYFELGQIFFYSDRHAKAASAYALACDNAPWDGRFAAQLVLSLYAVGDHVRAGRELGRARTLPDADLARLEILEDFGAYLAQFPRAQSRQIIEDVKETYEWVGTHRVADEIERAIVERRGFALVRLGDGEGPWARISADDEARFRHLYAWLRREWATLLFGASFDPVATGYFDVALKLLDTSARADVVGVPYPSWIEHQYGIASERGVPGLLNVHRWFLQHASEGMEKPLLCDQGIHVHLHKEGRLEPIIRAASRVGLISSNPEVAELIRSRFGVMDVELFKIPAERYTGQLRALEANAGIHFPSRYLEIMDALSVPQGGRLFLIAAGTLAKFYADKVKASGGIALDIGSLVDGWMGIVSRPGYEEGLKI